jgi:hypothetical protein
MVGLAGVTAMEIGCALPPAHVFKDTVNDPRNNITKTNLNFFKKISSAETLSIGASQSNINHLLPNAERTSMSTSFFETEKAKLNTPSIR